jgi:hypothetical protein
MSAYLLHLELQPFDEEMSLRIPEHRDYVNKLFLEGKILSYSVAAQRSMIWCVVSAENEQEAMGIAVGFPLYPHCVDVACHSLLLYNSQPAALPDISLN